jgi:predicted transcriptional regulator
LTRKRPSEIEILRALSDKVSLNIISSIATGVMKTSQLTSRSNLSKKRLYSRTAYMIKKGLIRRDRGHIFLTSLGKITYYSQLNIDNAIRNYWKLKAIDSIQDANEMHTEERIRIIKTIIGDDKIIQKILENHISLN